MHTSQTADRRRSATQNTTTNEQAGPGNPAPYLSTDGYSATPYQASCEPMRRPDNKAKKHSRPAKWAQRQAHKAQREQEYAA